MNLTYFYTHGRLCVVVVVVVTLFCYHHQCLLFIRLGVVASAAVTTTVTVLGAFANLQKATISFFLSICLHGTDLAPTGLILIKLYI
jgi:hypothetical protein